MATNGDFQRGAFSKFLPAGWKAILCLVSFASSIASASARAAEAPVSVDEAKTALRKAVQYFVASVATNGGYLWVYSEDLKWRKGEGIATETQIWVQPQGTPSVGFACLKAYQAAGDDLYLEAAKAAADALIWGQLESGGWDYKIDFDPEGSQKWYYRRDKDNPLYPTNLTTKKRRNYSVFDDNTTQSALRFIMAVHKAAGDEKYLSAVEYGLALMMRSQFENGAWPQAYPLATSGYSQWYTFNDNAINDCIKVMLDAFSLYGDEKYLDSAKRGGDFIIASQLPEPQAGWAQQYNYDMKPVHARWFEPAAVSGAETPCNIKTLIDLYLETGEEKYLDPIPSAIDWLERSKMENGQWARFYELGTNKPVYVNNDKKIVYEFVNVRSGYSWMGNYASDAIALYRKVKSMGREKYLAELEDASKPEARRKRLAKLAPRVRDAIAKQDAQGRWVEGGRISCSTFIKNVELLSEYISIIASLEG